MKDELFLDGEYMCKGMRLPKFSILFAISFFNGMRRREEGKGYKGEKKPKGRGRRGA